MPLYKQKSEYYYREKYFQYGIGFPHHPKRNFGIYQEIQNRSIKSLFKIIIMIKICAIENQQQQKKNTNQDIPEGMNSPFFYRI